MDHREIEDRNIPDLYLMNKLSSEARLQFEEHFISCPECLSRLEMTEDLRTALKNELIARPTTIHSARRSPFRTYGFALAAAAILISLGLLAVLAFRTWSEEQRQSAELRNRLAVATASLEQERNKSAQLNTQIAALAQQQGTVPVFPLVITRGASDTPGSALNSIVLPQAGWIIFLLDLPDVPRIETYKAVVRDSKGILVSDISGLKSTSRDTLAISVLSSLFMPGDYVISLEGLTSGRYMQLVSYSLHVLR
jgi:tetrahydromethanopterin S-methyltransferase subunit F